MGAYGLTLRYKILLEISSSHGIIIHAAAKVPFSLFQQVRVSSLSDDMQSEHAELFRSLLS